MANPNDVVTNASLQALLVPFLESIKDHRKDIDKNTKSIVSLEKRQESMDRNIRSSAVCIWNFPVGGYDLTPKTKNKADPVRAFLREVMEVPIKDVDSMKFRSIQIIPMKGKGQGGHMVRIDFIDCEAKDLCWSHASNLAKYNEKRPNGRKVSWKNDLTVEQRKSQKRKWAVGRNNGESSMDQN
jgi:hypothetical protein